MFKGRSVFLLDLISNSLGAVLLLFLLLISRHFERPPPRVEATLVVLAEAERGDARLGLWLEPPGAGDQRLFTEEISELDWRESAGGYRRTGTAESNRLSLDAYFRRVKFLRSPMPDSGSAGESPAGAGFVVPEPATGCWVFAPYYEDSPGLLSGEAVETPVRMRVWFQGLLERSGTAGGSTPAAPSSAQVFRAPTSETRHCIEITEEGIAPETGCCRAPP